MKRRVRRSWAGNCRGKKRYRDHVEATRVLHNASRPTQVGLAPVRAYECTACGGWHLTSKPSGARP